VADALVGRKSAHPDVGRTRSLHRAHEAGAAGCAHGAGTRGGIAWMSGDRMGRDGISDV